MSVTFNLIAHGNDTIILHKLSTGSYLNRSYSLGLIHSLQFIKSIIIAGTYNGKIIFFQTPNLINIKQFIMSKSALIHMKFSEDFKQLAYQYSNNKLKIIDFEAKKLFYTQDILIINFILFNIKEKLIVLSSMPNLVFSTIIILKNFNIIRKIDEMLRIVQIYKSACCRLMIFKSLISKFYSLNTKDYDTPITLKKKIRRFQKDILYSKQTLIISSFRYIG